ncbi:MAG: lmo0937 family membrane protein [Chloroflexota bacterium]
MVWAMIAILLILWLLGFTLVNLGSIIHALLVVALVVLIIQLISGRRSAV